MVDSQVGAMSALSIGNGCRALHRLQRTPAIQCRLTPRTIRTYKGEYAFREARQDDLSGSAYTREWNLSACIDRFCLRRYVGRDGVGSWSAVWRPLVGRRQRARSAVALMDNLQRRQATFAGQCGRPTTPLVAIDGGQGPAPCVEQPSR